MDLLQVALVLLIVLLGVFLSVLGMQVFFILKELRKALDKIDLVVNDAHRVASVIEKPIAAAAEVVETKIKQKTAQGKTVKPEKRLFKAFKRG